ncbi:Long-chain-fatty-acid--CoA ligase [bioreactor metagenome]|uniref:Long-chain-fatty-acid--CoA ligase n=1 Tax=bioreactor metagenome TaxID=1076179 RepID=A0A644VY93_9ZZZZ
MEGKLLQNLNFYRKRTSGTREAIYDYDNGIRYTYHDMYERASKLANFLVKECSLKKGDCIAFCSSNDVAFFDAYLAGFQTGIIISTYNFKLHADELIRLIRNEKPKVLFYEAGCFEKIQEFKKNTAIERYFVLFGDPAGSSDPCYEAIMEKPSCPPLETSIEDEDIQMYLHTGGTTGTPKTAMISYRAMFYNTVCDVFTNALSMTDTAYVFLPLFHTSAWNIITVPLLMCGGKIIISKGFVPKTVLKIIEEERPTVGMAVPEVYKRLSEEDSFMRTDFSCYKWLSSGGATAQKAMMERYWSRGIRLANGYGMTEIGPHNMTLPLLELSMDTIREKWRSVGVPMYFNSVRIVDGNMEDVPCGTCGELVFSGPLLFSGYLNNDEETAKVMEGGWMHTGDMARQDKDGYYYIAGRKKHMFVSGGENIYTVEIEAVIGAYPAVRDVCVIGVQDDRWGEVGKAVIVAEKENYCEEEFRTFLKQNLCTIKIPKYIQLVDMLPLNNAGKKDLSQINRLYGSI